MVHAKFAGEETIVMVPFFAEQENGKTDVVAGDIGYYPGRQTLCLFYGETQAVRRGQLRGAGAEQPGGAGPLRAQDPRDGIAAGADGAGLMAYVSAATLVEELREFTADRWMGEPPDVARAAAVHAAADGQPAVRAVLQLRPVLGRASSCRWCGRRRSTATCGCPSCAR